MTMRIDKMGFKVCGCLLAIAVCGQSWADKWVSAAAAVGGNGTEASPYQTIQQAIDAATANETIWVKPGTGTLAMYVGDAEEPEAVWTVSSDPVSYSWKPSGDLALRFVYEPGAADTGAAYLSAFEDAKGMRIFVR